MAGKKLKKQQATKKEIAAKQALAEMLAEQLMVGQRVRIQKDDGDEIETRVTSYPWQTGYDQWVVGLEGFSVACDITWVRAIDGRRIDFPR